MTLRERLQNAEQEYHLLVTGQKARVIVDQNGERIEYTATTASRLAQYIQSLKSQLDSTSKIGPLRVFF